MQRPVRLEIGLTTPEPTECGTLAKLIARLLNTTGGSADSITIVACTSYGKATGSSAKGCARWMLAPSPTKKTASSNTTKKHKSFRFLSSWIQPQLLLLLVDTTMVKCAKVLKHVEGIALVTVNPTVGLRLQILLAASTSSGEESHNDLTCPALIRLCQLFIKYEAVIDSLLPTARRTGSTASQKFFRSNRLALMDNNQKNQNDNNYDSTATTDRGGLGAAIITKQLLERIGSCANTEALVELVNPKGGCYKLNLRHCGTNGSTEEDSASKYLEFRQHSSTSNASKLQAWVTLGRALVERAVTTATKKAPLVFHSAHDDLEQQFQIMCTTLLPKVASHGNSTNLRVFYSKRRKALNPGDTTTTTSSRKSSSVTTAATNRAMKKLKLSSNNNTTATKAKATVTCGCCLEKITGNKDKKGLVCTCQEKGHVFCASCVCQYAETELFTNQNGQLRCIAIATATGSGCHSEFNSRQLERILPLRVHQKFKELQYIQIAKAQGLVNCECPKCGSKGQIPKTDKTFSCPSGGCRFHSCRRCGEPAHEGFMCSEVEKQVVRNGRTAVEEAMSEERIRNCPKCRTPVVLDSGCNAITCGSCRIEFCHQCRLQQCTCPGSMHAFSRDHTDRQAVLRAGTTAVREVGDTTVRAELTRTDLVNRLR